MTKLGGAMMKLNGWQRLWVVVSVLLFVVVGLLVVVDWPTYRNIRHDDDFIKQLSDEALLSLRLPPWERYGEPLVVVMPNGLELQFAQDTPEEEQVAVAREYTAILEAEARRERLRLIGTAFLYWAGICAALYALGWAVGWIWRGFRRSGDSRA